MSYLLRYTQDKGLLVNLWSLSKEKGGGLSQRRTVG